MLRPEEELKFLFNEEMLNVSEHESCNCFSKRQPSLCGIGDSKKDLSVEYISSSPRYDEQKLNKTTVGHCVSVHMFLLTATVSKNINPVSI